MGLAIRGSAIRDSIEKERILSSVATTISKDHPNMKLFKQRLEEDYTVPAGYNALAVGLEVPDNVNLTIPAGTKLVNI